MRNRVLRVIPTQGHSRSFILQSVTGQQGVAYHHIYIAGLICEVSEEVATQIAKNCHRLQLHSHLRPRQEEPLRISAYTLYFHKLESLAYISVAAGVVYLYSKLCNGLQNTHLFCNRVSAFWHFKVVQGHSRSMILVPIEGTYTTSY